MAAHPQEQYVVDPSGKTTAVILSLRRYQELMEDVHDLAVVAERRKERTVSLDEMKRRLKKRMASCKVILKSHRWLIGTVRHDA